MRNEERTLLTLEERLERSARSQAASPEAASGLVKRFSEIPAFQVFFGKSDVETMYELTGEFWEHPSVSMDSYSGFSRSFRLAMEHDNDSFRLPTPELSTPELSTPELSASELLPREMSLAEGCDPYKPVWGVRMNNAMILLGLMLLDHAKGSLRPRNIYHCTRMTLGQYLEALEYPGPGKAEGQDLRRMESVGKAESQELSRMKGLGKAESQDLSRMEGLEKAGSQDSNQVESFRRWRDALLKDYDGSRSLEETLADILRRYIAAWQEFDHLDHVLRCMGGLSCYLEVEEAGRTLPQEKEDSIRHFRTALCRYGSDLEGWELVEVDKRYLNPDGYYFTLACEYLEDVPDPGSRNVPPGTLRSQIFLSERDYSPKALRELAARSPSTDLRELLEKYICEERLASAMREINKSVTDLYLLWVEPYLRMGVCCECDDSGERC